MSLLDRIVEQYNVLRNNANGLSQGFAGNLTNVLTIY